MEDDPDLQRAVFTHYVSSVTFPKLYAKTWLKRERGLDDLPLHDLIALLANRKNELDRGSSVLTEDKIQVCTYKLNLQIFTTDLCTVFGNPHLFSDFNFRTKT